MSEKLPFSETWNQEEDLSPKEFKLFQDLVYRHAGINVPDTKRLLLVVRLSRRLRALGMMRFSDYYDYLTGHPGGQEEMVEFINVITTNKTDFFRENHHFDYLKSAILPEVLDHGRGSLRIWSAGCSTGEEAYTIAMVVWDFCKALPGLELRILATDLATNVLNQAAQGVYPMSKLEEIPSPYRDLYTVRIPEGFSIHPAVKSLISFKRLNLMRPSFPFSKGFNIIFCRNVMIYFRTEDRPLLIGRFRAVLRDQGYLILGHSESLLNQQLGFRTMANTIYKKI